MKKLNYKCFDVECWEEFNKQELKGNVCFEKDLKEHLGLFQALITSNELSKDEILYNFLKICGNWIEK